MMPVIRNSAANSLNSLFNVVTTTADSANNAIASIGRLSAAGYAKADAYATDVEANAAAAKAVAGKMANERATLKVYEAQREIAKSFKTKEECDNFNALLNELFPKE